MQEPSGRYVFARVISATDTKMLLLDSVGKMSLADRCKSVAADIIPEAETADMVQFPWNGTFNKVGKKIRWVFIDFSLVMECPRRRSSCSVT